MIEKTALFGLGHVLEVITVERTRFTSRTEAGERGSCLMESENESRGQRGVSKAIRVSLNKDTEKACKNEGVPTVLPTWAFHLWPFVRTLPGNLPVVRSVAWN